MNTPKITGTQYCILRFSDKYYSIKEVKSFEGHMTRTFNTINADETRIKNNEILIGTKDIVKDVEKYIEGIPLRSNGVLGREIMLTASPEFFKGRSYGGIKKWAKANIDYLQEQFGTNIIHAVLHMDETTPHLHCLLIPRFEAKRGKSKYRLCDRDYFGEKNSYSKYQDSYAEYITEKFPILHRGMKGSKAKHVKIKQYYTLVNADLNCEDMQSIMAKAKNSVLLEKQIVALQDLLKENLKKEDNREELINMVKQLKEDKEIYKETIKSISEGYKISQEAIINIVKSIEGKTKDVVKENERELSIITKSQSE